MPPNRPSNCNSSSAPRSGRIVAANRGSPPATACSSRTERPPPRTDETAAWDPAPGGEAIRSPCAASTGRSRHIAGQEAEADANPQPPRLGKQAANLLDQVFLFRRTQRDEDDVRRRGKQHRADGHHFVQVVFKSERRAVRADDLQRGVAALENLRRFIRRARLAAQQENRPTFRRRAAAQRRNQIRTRDALRQGSSLQPARPDQRHPIGHHQLCLGHQRREAQVARRPTHVIEIRRDYRPALTGVQLAQNVIDASFAR